MNYVGNRGLDEVFDVYLVRDYARVVRKTLYKGSVACAFIRKVVRRLRISSPPSLFQSHFGVSETRRLGTASWRRGIMESLLRCRNKRIYPGIDW
jgi:hypothetical protein